MGVTWLLTCSLKLKCRETGEWAIIPYAEKGTLKFNGPNLASFTGKADLLTVGDGVQFIGRKVSDIPVED
jgi:hypothetical protein